MAGLVILQPIWRAALLNCDMLKASDQFRTLEIQHPFPEPLQTVVGRKGRGRSAMSSGVGIFGNRRWDRKLSQAGLWRRRCLVWLPLLTRTTRRTTQGHEEV